MRRKSKLIWKFFICYIVIFVLFWFFSSLLINHVIEIYKQNIQSSTNEKLLQTAKLIDRELEEYCSLSDRIYSDQETNPRVLQTDIQSIRAGLYQLTRYLSETSLSKHLLLSYDNRNFYLENGSISLKALAQNTMRLNDKSTAELMTFVQNRTFTGIRAFICEENSSQKSWLVFACPVPSGKTVGDGIICYLIPDSALEKILEEILLSYSGSAQLLQEDGTVVASVSVASEDAREFDWEATAGTQKGYSLFYYTSVYGFKIRIAIDSQDIWGSLYRLQFRILLLLFVFFVLCALIILHLGRLNVRPIHRIQDIVQGQYGLAWVQKTARDSSDVFSVIQEAIQQSFQKQHQSEESLKQLRSDIFSHILSILIEGNSFKGDDISQLLHQFGLQLSGPYYCIMGIPIDAFEHPINWKNMWIPEIKFTLCTADGRDYFVTVICLDSYDQEYIMREEFFWQTYDILSSYCTVRPRAAFGMVYSSLSEIPQSYREMLASSKSLLSSDSDKMIVYFDKITKLKQTASQSLDDHLQELEAAIVRKKLKAARKAVVSILQICSSSPFSEEERNYFRYNLLQKISEDFKKGDASIGLQRHLADISVLDDNQFCFSIKKLFSDSEPFWSEMESTSDCPDILEFLKENYKSSELSLEAIADKYNMSLSSMSRYIKVETGLGYSEYLVSLRMAEACRLLRESDRSIQSIICEVGYIDNSSFSRKFKKLYNLSPSEYRENFSSRIHTS